MVLQKKASSAGVSGKGAGLLIFLCWLAYATSYLGKVNYSATITEIISFYGITKPEAGLAPTFFFFAYGIGQIFNGLLCKHYPIKWVVFGSMATSAAINLTIAISTDFSIIKWLWMLNGIVLSILWPSLIRLLSENVPRKDLGRATLVLGTTVASGTLIIYALSSVFAHFNHFKLSFYTAAICGGTVALIWLILFRKAVSLSRAARDGEETVESSESGSTQEKDEWKPTRNEKRLFLFSICVLCFCAVGVNLIKDGLNTWVPSILKETYGMPSSLSILLTLFLPVVALFGNFFALSVHKKVPDYVSHCALIFTAIALVIGSVIGCLALELAIPMLIGLVVASFLASGMNSLLTSIFPLFMRGRVSSGLLAGIINGFCYVGSTISSYGLGFIAQSWGWNAVFWTLIAFCVAVGVVWAIYRTLKAILLAR